MNNIININFYTSISNKSGPRQFFFTKKHQTLAFIIFIYFEYDEHKKNMERRSLERKKIIIRVIFFFLQIANNQKYSRKLNFFVAEQ